MAPRRGPKPPDDAGSARLVVVGRVEGAWGVQGWLRVRSFTEQPSSILAYGPWELRRGGSSERATVLDGREHAGGVVVRLAQCNGREEAARLAGAEILVPRSSLPPLPVGQYYWTDLEGLEVLDRGGRRLGAVERVMDTGANDVLVVSGDREILVPMIPGVMLDVDIAAGWLRVDWDPDY